MKIKRKGNWEPTRAMIESSVTSSSGEAGCHTSSALQGFVSQLNTKTTREHIKVSNHSTKLQRHEALNKHSK